MKQSKIKADEMEMFINVKSLKIAYIFTELCLMIYCIYHFFTTDEISAVTVIWLVSIVIFFVSKLVYTHRITSSKETDE